MIQSFITIALRILWRNKITSFVNIFSLSVGITSFIFIMLYVHHETSYDKFNLNYDHIYRLEGDNYAKLPPVIGIHIKDRIPEIKKIARISNIADIDILRKPDRNPENIRHVQTSVLWADSTTFDVFTFSFIKGDPALSLRHPFTCVISESVAENLFGDSNPMGKIVDLLEHQFEVTGIIKDIEKSHLEAKVLLSFSSIPLMYPDRNVNNTGRSSWLWSATYLLITDKIDEAFVEKKINGVLTEINDGNLFDTEFREFRLRPLKDIYFYGALQNLDYAFHGSFKLISILSVIGVFMLVLACINYVNLTTARSTVRTKEVAVKRIVGSSIALVRFQFIAESIITSVLSLGAALTAVQIFIGLFNEVAMVNINIASLNRWEIWLGLFIGAVCLGIVAGIYPALYFTAVIPVKLVRGTDRDHDSAGFSRSLLMTFQFSLSIILIVCAIANLRQLDYVRHADLGFRTEQVIQVQTASEIGEELALRETFKNELLQFPDIIGIAYSAGSPGGFIPRHPIDIDGKKQSVDFFLIDHDYLDVMNIELSSGKSFTRRNFADSHEMFEKNSILINESAVRELGLKNPVGKSFYWDDQGTRRAYEVIGVVKDFHFRSLHHKIGPLMLVQTPPMMTANIKLQSSNVPATLRTIEKAWKKVYGDRLFSFKFLDEKYNLQYKSDEQLATIIGWFTGIALIIACLGLFALSSFMVTRRTKEIGIRKSLGASIRSIYVMLSWDFLKWIVLAIVVSFPIAWYLLQLWLSKFAYHIKLETDIFILSALFATSVALLTVTLQSWKAASANPVKSLRYE
jgi:putative ABC transport system permease protein